MAIFLSFLLLTTLIGVPILFYLFFKKTNIEKGKVVSKKHLPATSESPTFPIVTNHTGLTSMDSAVALKYRYPEAWEIIIKNKFRTASYYVSKKVYDQVQVGQRFAFQDYPGSKERPKEEYKT